MSMTKSNYSKCKTCKFRNEESECISGKMSDEINWSDEKGKDMVLYSYNEGGSFFVGEEFGCVHHEEK